MGRGRRGREMGRRTVLERGELGLESNSRGRRLVLGREVERDCTEQGGGSRSEELDDRSALTILVRASSQMRFRQQVLRTGHAES